MGNAITRQTRRESYEEVKKTLGKRHNQCLNALRGLGGSATANEVARYLLDNGEVPYYNTNFTNPRLIELAELGKVEVTGKKKDEITNRTVAIYSLKNE